MKILLIGLCRNNDLKYKPRAHQRLVEEIGKELAITGYEIITGDAGGLQGILVSFYKKSSGKKWTAHLALEEEKNNNAGLLSDVRPDKQIKTKLNYATRNVYYLRKCGTIIALGGKL